MSRDEDMDLLREVLTHPLDPETREAFDDMLKDLTSGERFVLSDRQRAWVSRFTSEPVYENLASRGKVPTTLRHNHKEFAECTARCPLFVPKSLQNLPKRPPGGRA